MRILEVTKVQSNLLEVGTKPNSNNKLMHGLYARNHDIPQNMSGDKATNPLTDGNDYYVWLYDLQPLIGPANYTPGAWWNPDITPKDEDPDVEVDPNSDEYKRLLDDAKVNTPAGSPDIKAITKAILQREPDAELTDAKYILKEYIPNNSTSGAWHRVGTENEPFNLGRANNPQLRELVAKLMFLINGDRRFVPDYDSRTNRYNYEKSTAKNTGNIESDGSVDRAYRTAVIKKIKKDNEKYQEFQAETTGTLLKHDRAYAMKGSGVKYIYKGEFPGIDKDGKEAIIKMDPLKNPNNPNHRPYFVRQSDQKKVPQNSMTHALLCASLGYEADTVTRIPPSSTQKIQDWFTEQFSLYGDDLDPKAPLFTKIIKRGVYNPISNAIFGMAKKGLTNHYGTLKKAYSWQKHQGKIDESEEAKKSIVYWENKLSKLLVSVKQGRTDQSTGSLLDEVQVHLDAYKDAVKNKTLDKKFRQISLQNIKKYEDILTRYYGGKFRKGQLVIVQPDEKANPSGYSGGAMDFPTINFKCSGKVMGAGIDKSDNTVPFAKENEISGQVDPDTGKVLTRPTRILNSVLVKLHYPELGLNVNQKQGLNGDGFYFYTGEVFPLKGKNTLTMSKDQHEILEKLRKEIQQEKEQEMPDLTTNEEEDKQINDEANEGAGGSPEELEKPTGGPIMIKHRELKPGSIVAWKGVSGVNKGKEVKGTFESFDEENPNILNMKSLTKKWLTFKLDIAHVTDVLNKSGTRTGTASGSTSTQYKPK